MEIQAPKGTKDVLPQDSYKWHEIYRVVESLSKKYNLKEIMTPTFESTELFLRSVGDSSDVVNKEMYTFLDKGERSIKEVVDQHLLCTSFPIGEKRLQMGFGLL